MFSQDEIDAVLNDAQSAVNALADDVGQLAPQAGGSVPASAGSPAPAPVAASVAAAPSASPRALAAISPADRLKRILKLRVPVVVRLAERPMLLSEIMKVVPGTILEFSRTVDEELDLLVNNHQIGSGVAVKVNERFGLRVTYVGDIRHRLSSLTAS